MYLIPKDITKPSVVGLIYEGPLYETILIHNNNNWNILFVGRLYFKNHPL